MSEEWGKDWKIVQKFIDGHMIIVDEGEHEFRREPAPSSLPVRAALDRLRARQEEQLATQLDWASQAGRLHEQVLAAEARVEELQRERDDEALAFDHCDARRHFYKQRVGVLEAALREVRRRDCMTGMTHCSCVICIGRRDLYAALREAREP